MLQEWAQKLRITAGTEEKGEEILRLIEEHKDLQQIVKSIEDLLLYNDVVIADKLYDTLELIVERYCMVRDMLSARDEFDLAKDNAVLRFQALLDGSNRAHFFRYRVIQMLIEVGALLPNTIVTNTQALAILEHLLP